MLEQSYLTGQFLIAMPGLADPNFSHTVTYICMHSAEGAMGIIINRSLGMNLGEVLEHMHIVTHDPALKQVPIFQGGPVEPERGFVLHRSPRAWESTLNVADQIGVTTSRDVLNAMARGEGPSEVFIALGYAGWGAGQLERELAENAWLNGPVDFSIMFNTPVGQRWQAAAAHLGVDLNLISSQAGHG